MAVVGASYEHAVAETFMKTLRWEEVRLKRYATFAEAEVNFA